ncbi:reductase [Sphaerisporangium krabiense]|uniref:Nucleoside-diphosphate-sugar epimerase n=1 Tax=Sphaerisporangium krabiense TaxID=763782 RepID=A0A7W8Z0B7_9ACTN|nr:NAD-dependent epimerase/dehydratase family protein [Sphaerisporangium krabiense]MBB5625128.1 nucleoside-diphosphate-sugar epimerase [Sphaerisporangium krabiense]GII67273.1 reductase [Sphaerisporangium krabiense]
MPRALILGGTGMIGRATALRLLAAGWQVTVTGRNPANMPSEVAAAGGGFVSAGRADAGELQAALADGVELLVDCICYTAADARLLLPLARDAGSTVLISSKAVYVDAHGNHPNSDIKPRYDGPIRETQATMAPRDIDHNSREGYGANKVAAEHVALDSGLPISVLRPSLIHGVGAAFPREWVFVKRALDRRPAVLLAGRGSGTAHPTAAANVATLIETVARAPGARILNIADPDVPSALDISRTIARHLGHDREEVLLDDSADPDLGLTPWDSKHPVVLDMSAATELGYRPVGDYATTVAAEVDWLVDAARNGDRAGIPPAAGDPRFSRFLDYAAEDRFLAGRRRRQGPSHGSG